MSKKQSSTARTNEPMADMFHPICGRKHNSDTEATACWEQWRRIHAAYVTRQDEAAHNVYFACCFGRDESFEAEDD